MNIQYRTKTMSVAKKEPQNYQFKYAPNNGKNSEQVKMELEESKKV